MLEWVNNVDSEASWKHILIRLIIMSIFSVMLQIDFRAVLTVWYICVAFYMETIF
jgi:hypothetical protein